MCIKSQLKVCNKFLASMYFEVINGFENYNKTLEKLYICQNQF